MGSGLPVIASSIAGNEELVIPGETGLLVPAEDTHALQAALRSLLGDEPRRERMGRAGHARAAEMYGWSAAASQYREMLQKAVR
jgi:glycosyltransferase involved in cell wall biosynthesis